VLMTIMAFDVAYSTNLTALFHVNSLYQLSVSKYLAVKFCMIFQDLTEYMNSANSCHLQGYSLENPANSEAVLCDSGLGKPKTHKT